jgi:hypothetical protein
MQQKKHDHRKMPRRFVVFATPKTSMNTQVSNSTLKTAGTKRAEAGPTKW